jgi:hypothetical protein
MNSPPISPYRDRCRHFTGIQHDTCAAGIKYTDVQMQFKEHPRVRLPCLDAWNPPVRVPETCPARSFITQEEHAEQEREFREAGVKALSAMKDGRCPVCGEPIEPSKVIGRCQYASCGHRLGQVKP